MFQGQITKAPGRFQEKNDSVSPTVPSQKQKNINVWPGCPSLHIGFAGKIPVLLQYSILEGYFEGWGES